MRVKSVEDYENAATQSGECLIYPSKDHSGGNRVSRKATKQRMKDAWVVRRKGAHSAG
jgi:hypothetical protein